jgi:hypothetical protein
MKVTTQTASNKADNTVPPLDATLTGQIATTLTQQGITATTRVTASQPLPGKIPTLAQLQKTVMSEIGGSIVNGTIASPDSQTVKDLNPWPAKLTPHSIPFRYIPDGCYARAHMMVDRMQQDGYSAAKIYAIGNLSAKNSVFPQGVSWWYHVAPLVLVNDNGKQRLVVVDPAVNPNNPIMAPEVWIAAIDPSKAAVKVEVADANQYYPMNGAPPSTTPFASNLKPADGVMVKYTESLNSIGASASPAASGAAATPATHDRVESAKVVDVTPDNEVHLHNSARRIKATPAQAATLREAKAKGTRVHVTVSHAANAEGFHTISSIEPAR